MTECELRAAMNCAMWSRVWVTDLGEYNCSNVWTRIMEQPGGDVLSCELQWPTIPSRTLSTPPSRSAEVRCTRALRQWT